MLSFGNFGGKPSLPNHDDMGLLTIIKQVKLEEREMRLLILGLDNAGKTTVVKRFKGEPIDTISPTLGFNIETLAHDGYTLNVWDVGGQKTIRSYWRNYFEATDGLIWVVDSADALRLESTRAELSALLGEERLFGASLLVLANKQDIDGALDAPSIARALDLVAPAPGEDAGPSSGASGPAETEEGEGEGVRPTALSAKRHWHIQPCSAVTGEGLVEGIDWIVKDIADRVYMFD